MVLFLCSLPGCGGDSVEIRTYGTEDTAAVTASELPGRDTDTSDPGRSVTVTEQPQDTGTKTAEATIVVHVCGAVRVAGVYHLPEGSRVADAVALAGGCKEDAAEYAVNLARQLSDGEQVYIPTVREAEEGVEPAGSEGSGPQSPKEETESDGRVDINHAGADRLADLPGIGPGKAADIIAYREKNGEFQKPEDLMKVPGIKEGTYQKLKDRIYVK